MKATQVEVKKTVFVGACIVCHKPVEAFYGRWGNTGTCSRKCEVEQENITEATFNNYRQYLAKKGESDGVT